MLRHWVEHNGERLFLDTILWLVRTASPWRDLPPELGNWRTVHCRFRRWTLSGVWESLFKTLSQDPDFEYVLVPSRQIAAQSPAGQWDQWGGCPQARGLIEGLEGVRHVMADAAYDADHLRQYIADDLAAEAQIKQNPARSTLQTIDWVLYKERYLVECFFNRIKRFRRIALRCEKTISSF